MTIGFDDGPDAAQTFGRADRPAAPEVDVRAAVTQIGVAAEDLTLLCRGASWNEQADAERQQHDTTQSAHGPFSVLWPAMHAVLCALVMATLIAMPSAAQPVTYGMNVRPGLSALQADKLLELGAPTARVVFGWDTIEPNCKRCFNWTITDAWVQEARRTRIEIYATLAYTPGWANGGRHYTYPPIDRRDWFDFVLAVVSRYRDDVHLWGLWNEANLDKFFHDADLREYQAIAALGAAAVRSADPRARIIGPDVSHHAFKDGWFVEAMRTIGDLFDIIAVHWYADGPDLDYMMDELVRPFVGDKPVWLTETGIRPCDSALGEVGQAVFYNTVLAKFLARRSWWTGLLFYNLHDPPAPGDCGSGIVRDNYSHRPAFLLLQAVIRAHP